MATPMLQGVGEWGVPEGAWEDSSARRALSDLRGRISEFGGVEEKSLNTPASTSDLGARGVHLASLLFMTG